MASVRMFLKSLIVGGLYCLMSFTVYTLGCVAVDIFKDMLSLNGIYAVSFFFAGVLVAAVTLVTLFFMGALPIALSLELKDAKKKNGGDAE